MFGKQGRTRLTWNPQGIFNPPLLVPTLDILSAPGRTSQKGITDHHHPSPHQRSRGELSSFF